MCQSCYGNEHIGSQNTLKLQRLDFVGENYKFLSAKDKSKVQDTSYKTAKTYLLVVQTTEARET